MARRQPKCTLKSGDNTTGTVFFRPVAVIEKAKHLKLTLPPPQITLYKDGLQSHDKLDRKPLADRLSKLLESIDDPLVVALDGGWGSGKSVFLQCWVGEHLREKSHTATTLYFDAFENDYLDDPLIALTGALTDRLTPDSPARGALKKLRLAAYKILPLAARLGLAAATAGGTEAAGAIGGALINQSAKDVEKAAEAYWKREDGRRAAMQQFRDALKALTEPDNDGTPQKKLVIVIDELDRCRPDYALQLLEVIKHFFATPGVHFVLGVNLHELANSVRARYGAGIDAERYLHKFVQIRMPIQPRGYSGQVQSIYLKHFEYVCETLKIDAGTFSYFRDYLQLLGPHAHPTLRDMERLGSLIATTSMNLSEQGDARDFLGGLMIIQVLRPSWIELARQSDMRYKFIAELFDWNGNSSSLQRAEYLRHRWQTYLDGVEALSADELSRYATNEWRNAKPEMVARVIAQHLDAFALPN